MTSDNILKLLSGIVHPEKENNIIALGMVEALEVVANSVKFTLKLERARDPFAISIKKAAIRQIEESYPNAEVTIFIKEPNPKAKPGQAAKPASEGSVARSVIAISSGKGGVGKSTVTANLAVTLAQQGYKVGVIDADIYGPSLPKMFGVEDYKPIATEENGKEYITPAESFGVKLMSIGFFIQPSDALVWRGPMATNALRQLTHQTKWGELDFLLVDLPPGTGDVHLTMIQELSFTGAIIVSTPQEVALLDVVRGINMFRAEKINIPIIGLVENMAWFTPKELPNNRYYIFGNGGCKALAQKESLKLLSQVPIVMSVGQGGDSGTPGVIQEPIIAEIFKEMSNAIIATL